MTPKGEMRIRFFNVTILTTSDNKLNDGRKMAQLKGGKNMVEEKTTVAVKRSTEQSLPRRDARRP